MRGSCFLSHSLCAGKEGASKGPVLQPWSSPHGLHRSLGWDLPDRCRRGPMGRGNVRGCRIHRRSGPTRLAPCQVSSNRPAQTSLSPGHTTSPDSSTAQSPPPPAAQCSGSRSASFPRSTSSPPMLCSGAPTLGFRSHRPPGSCCQGGLREDRRPRCSPGPDRPARASRSVGRRRSPLRFAPGMLRDSTSASLPRFLRGSSPRQGREDGHQEWASSLKPQAFRL